MMKWLYNIIYSVDKILVMYLNGKDVLNESFLSTLFIILHVTLIHFVLSQIVSMIN